ncbi:transmembrane protein 53-like [Tubulanus polymorphus]|uniref:transmembrane protein 53-like n=1 Tax=Tubulanus polymorphus TaxID=672921 RepID=UPI003DA4B590
MARSRICLHYSGLTTLFRAPNFQLKLTATRSKSDLAKVITTNINKNFELRSLESANEKSSNKPLVILFAWLLARKKHIKNYSDYYLGRGFDVLNVRINPLQVLWPKTAQKVVHQILDYVREDRLKDRPILSHGFSVGGYLYGEYLVEITNPENQHADICDRMIGQIFDSPVDFEGIPNGFSKAVTTNPAVRRALYSGLNFYVNTFKTHMKPYQTASVAFKENRLGLKTLILYSKADVICNVETIEKTIADWRRSPHVSHMHMYRDEYVNLLDNYLLKIGIQPDYSTDDVIKEKSRLIDIDKSVRKEDRLKQ